MLAAAINGVEEVTLIAIDACPVLPLFTVDVRVLLLVDDTWLTLTGVARIAAETSPCCLVGSLTKRVDLYAASLGASIEPCRALFAYCSLFIELFTVWVLKRNTTYSSTKTVPREAASARAIRHVRSLTQGVQWLACSSCRV